MVDFLLFSRVSSGSPISFPFGFPNKKTIPPNGEKGHQLLGGPGHTAQVLNDPPVRCHVAGRIGGEAAWTFSAALRCKDSSSSHKWAKALRPNTRAKLEEPLGPETEGGKEGGGGNKALSP